MSAILPGYEYDIFISYRHNDNRSGWVSEFVKNLQEELATTIKEPVSVYYDSNPHDGLLETHNVDKSLEGKLKCLIFIPILSHTYCDPKSFAWNKEFLVFCKLAKSDPLGLDVRLINKNVASRILPVQIHDLDEKDKRLFVNESGGPIRAIDFIFRSPGVNRPLTLQDNRTDNLDRTFYRDQLNKIANAIEQIIEALSTQESAATSSLTPERNFQEPSSYTGISWLWNELLRRNVFRAAFTYLIVALLVHQLLIFLTPLLKLEARVLKLAIWILLVGFPFATLFAWFYEVSPQGIIRTTSPQAFANPFPPNKKKPLTGIPLITVLLLMLGFQSLYYNYIKPPAIDLDGNKTISIAVLPFENRSGDEKDKYIAEGISDDIINRLTIISKFRVTNRKNSEKFQGQLVSFDNIAKDLEVKILVTGSVDRHENQIVVRAQMIDETNTYLWGNTFHRTTENIVAVQSEIALMIANQLKIQLNDMEKTRLQLKATNNPTAYDYYLRGRSHYYKYSPAANDSAIAQFKQAIALDSNYARAWAGLADAFSQISGRFAGAPYWTDSSIVAANRAIQIDSTLSDGYKALGTAYNYRDDYEKAFPFLLRAVELNPLNEQAIGNLGTNYMLRGDLATALYWEKKGATIDPKNWIPYQIIGWIYRLLGDFENAERWLIKSLELNPRQHDTYEMLAYTYTVQGRSAEALALIPRVLEIDPNETRVLEAAGIIAHFAGNIPEAKKYYRLSIEKNTGFKEDRMTVSPIGLGQILLDEGNQVDAEVYLLRAQENFLTEINNGSKFFEPPFYLASIYAIRNDSASALAWLKKAMACNWLDYTRVTHGPYFNNLKGNDELNNLINHIRNKSDSIRAHANK